MTSEIAIMNKEGVALAADSAVTIGGEKIYNSAIKLFELTQKQPIGIMIYGNATFMGIPWETIIKMMRNKIHSKKIYFKTLEEGRTFFFDNLKEENFKPSSKDQEYILKTKIIKLIQIFINDSSREIEFQFQKGEITEEEFYKNPVKFLNKGLKIVENNISIAKDLKNLKYNFKEIKVIILNLLEELENLNLSYDIFQLEDFKKIDKQWISKIIIEYFKKEMFLIDISGIVISGFGENDIYPKLSESILEINYKNFLKYQEKQFIKINESQPLTAAIVPFGQDGDVHTFLRGIHPNFKDSIISTYYSQINILIEEIGSNLKLSPKKISKLNKIASDFGTNFQDLIDNYSQENHITAIINNVINLPKTELCEMAESLVNLMSFKQKVTSILETVGGPIDTAFISKGDGFIWIKRKHYFDPKLNHNFFKLRT